MQPPGLPPDRFAVIEAVLANNLNDLYGAIFSDCDVNLANDRGNTPLHASCFLDVPITFACLLLRAGAKPSARNLLGQTPLHFAAASSKDGALVELLLRSGADPLARDNHGATPRDMSKSSKAAEVLDAWLLDAWNEFLTLDPDAKPPSPQGKSPRSALKPSPMAAPVEALLQSLQALRASTAENHSLASNGHGNGNGNGHGHGNDGDGVLPSFVPAIPPSPTGSLRDAQTLSLPQPLLPPPLPPPLPLLPADSNEDARGFFVLVDGASVFVPAPNFTVPATQPDLSAHPVENEDPLEHLLALQTVESFATIVLDDEKDQSIGMLVREADVVAVIARVLAGSKASLAGIRKGDLLVQVNGQSCAGLSIEAVSRLLKSDRTLVLRLRRSQPAVVGFLLAQSGNVDWETAAPCTLAAVASVLMASKVPVAVFHTVLRAFQDGLAWLRRPAPSPRASEAKAALAWQLLGVPEADDGALMQAAVHVIDEGLRATGDCERDDDDDDDDAGEENLSESFTKTLSSLTG